MTCKEGENIPEARFKGFEDEWEIVKLGDMFDNFKEKNNEDKIILASTIDKGVIPNSLTERKIIRKKESLSNYKLVKKGCFVISLMSFQSGFEYSDYEGIISPAYTVLKPKIEMAPYFYKYYFKSYYFINKSLPKYAEGIRDGKQIKYKACKEILVPYPPLDEQKRIASALSKIDAYLENTIKLIEEKERFKRGIAKKLLTCKEGENIPEARFKGFEDEWMEVAISKIGTIITGNTPSTKNESFWNSNNVWVTPTDIKQKYISNSERKLTDDGLKKSRKLPANTLLITCIASIGKNAILKCEGACNQQINAIIPNKNYNVDFLYYLFENEKSYLKFKAPQSVIKIMSKSEFSKLVFKFPLLEEQEKIGGYLSSIDAEIDNLKKAKRID